jgi:Putative nucleotidyltransferase DUF294
MQKESTLPDHLSEVKPEEKLWNNFSKQMEELAQIDSTSESQTKLKLITEICDKLVESKTLVGSKLGDFSAQLRQLWTICTKDAKSILRYQNPRNYQKISSELQTLAFNFHNLIPLVKKFLPLNEQEKMFLTVADLYRQKGFWVKTSTIMAGYGFPLDASPFFVSYYETLLKQAGDSDPQSRKAIIRAMALEQATFLHHAFQYVSDTKDPISLESLVVNQIVINELVEEKLQLHKLMSRLLEDKLQIPETRDLERIEAKIHQISVTIMTHIFQSCESLLAKAGFTAPRFSVVGTGSFARKELSPTSDFDCAIIVDKLPSKQQEEYFKKLLDLVVENLELLPYNTLPLDMVERNYLEPGKLLNTPEGLVEQTLGAKMLSNPSMGRNPVTTGVNWPLLIHKSFPEKGSSKKLFESYITEWHRQIGYSSEKFGKLILKNFVKDSNDPTLKENFLRPVSFLALGFSQIYNDSYRTPKSLISAYHSGNFPASTREILKDLQGNTKIPKAVSTIAGKLIEILDYTLTMRNHYQITGKPEVLDLSDPRTQRYKEVITQSREIATFISDFSPSKEKVDDRFIELLKQGVESKEESLLQEFSDLVGEDAIDFRFPEHSPVKLAEEKGSPQPQSPKENGFKFFNSSEVRKTTGTSPKTLEPTPTIPLQTNDPSSFGTSC